MATIEVTKTIDKDGMKLTLNNPNFFPTYVSKMERIRNYRVVPLQDAEKFGLKNAKNIYEEIQKHMLGNLSQ